MPFKNSQENISISDIKNKNVVTQVYDSVFFANYKDENPENKKKIMDSIKEHIQNYGAVYANIHGASSDTACFNIKTGAIYCDPNEAEKHPEDHAIAIIGWDDNFPKENFKKYSRK